MSGPAQRTALEVLAANNVDTIIQRDEGFTPTPVISRAILVYNRNRKEHLADGIVITPSHNPPADGGFKYNPPNGGPADTDVTRWVERRANGLLRDGTGIKRVPFAAAIKADTTHQEDFVVPYVEDLRNVIDMSADGGDCEAVLKQFAAAGIDIDELAAKLQDDGAKSFVSSWNELMGVIASKSATLAKAG